MRGKSNFHYLPIVALLTGVFYSFLAPQQDMRANWLINQGSIAYVKAMMLDNQNGNQGIVNYYNLAENYYLQVLENQPENETVHKKLKVIYWNMSDNNEFLHTALENYHKIYTPSQRSDGYYYIGNALQENQDWETALTAYQYALDTNLYISGDLNIYIIRDQMASLYEFLHQYPLATNFFYLNKQEFVLEPYRFRALYNLGWISRAEGDQAASREYYQLAAELINLPRSYPEQFDFDNLVKNGSFEYGREFWVIGTYESALASIVECDSKLGKFCWQLEFDGSDEFNYYMTTQDIAVEPSTRYRLSYWVKTNGLEKGIYLLVNLKDTQVVTNNISGDNNWIQVIKEFQTTDNDSEVRIRLMSTSQQGMPAKVWIDNIRLEKISGG